HWLAYVCWPIAVAHAIGIGTDTKHGWEDLILGLCVAAVVYAAGWRLVEGALARRAAQRSGALTRAPARASSVTPTGRRPSSVPPVRRPVASSSRRP
ncbi:MAG TPA: hypothetical protein VKG43_10680, partial [Acidimicrobiales bacterium]|nr:hypothetical protein [Acidimicrobiales bacterium]